MTVICLIAYNRISQGIKCGCLKMYCLLYVHHIMGIHDEKVNINLTCDRILNVEYIIAAEIVYLHYR